MMPEQEGSKTHAKTYSNTADIQRETLDKISRLVRKSPDGLAYPDKCEAGGGWRPIVRLRAANILHRSGTAAEIQTRWPPTPNRI